MSEQEDFFPNGQLQFRIRRVDDTKTIHEWFWSNGQLRCREHFVKNRLHNLEGPARESWYESGFVDRISYCVDGDYHNLEGPADQCWYENGQLEVSRYFQDGHLHNLNGPAEELWDEQGNQTKEVFWIEGARYSRAGYLALLRPTKSANKT